MYNIELQHLTIENAQNEVLRAAENICSNFHLEAHFGTLSYALHELLSLMERYSDDQSNAFDINFYIEQDTVSIQIVNYQNFKEIERCLHNASIDDNDTSAYTFTCLSDRVEFRDDYREMWVEMMLNADIETIDRAQILEQETILSRVKALQEKSLQ